MKTPDNSWVRQAAAQQLAQTQKPIDWSKIINKKPRCSIKYLDLSKYDDIPWRHAINPVLQDIQDKLNEIIAQINKE